MNRSRQPANEDAEKSLPHEGGRDKAQPYAKEDEDYSGRGVMRPPKEQAGKRAEKPPRKK